eukprot:3751622-Rhodomonas_salina.2
MPSWRPWVTTPLQEVTWRMSIPLRVLTWDYGPTGSLHIVVLTWDCGPTGHPSDWDYGATRRPEYWSTDMGLWCYEARLWYQQSTAVAGSSPLPSYACPIDFRY